ncbi:uncharacterized protein LOC103998633 [Musa acuminata AAA Group]|uniref:(wild Malaysian banana) hypothetical protein n=1 Tax=Musa acuminata subsp. malaccensis TaxID=214687 RepID=A0A804KMF5_MUSAM|nr:PREDICTED: uncharacterized protein LOC103998633 [Musa acuminata subsp. malaccensis]CAG1836121.1 unnamed protein product [Musa acuminata subsp. malaccensis]
MAFSSFRAVLPSPHPPAAKDSDVVGIAQNKFRATNKVNEVKLVGSISRRDAMSCLFATLMATSARSDPAEARSVKPETRRKIREKLNKLREKAGVPKDKTAANPKNKENPPASPEDRLTAPLVEATL